MTKLLKSLAIIAGVTGLFFFLFFGKEKTAEAFFWSLVISALYTFVLGIGNGLINTFLDRKFSWTEDRKIRIITGIIATILVNAILVLLCNYIHFIVFKDENPADFFSDRMNIRHWFIINLALMISAVMHAKGFMDALKSSTRKEVVEQKLIARSANAQFESLKNQLDPHFLFNSLNVLSALIDENPDLAQRFTSSMSKIYRYVLEQKDKELVTVEEEVDFAKTYCDLLKSRFEDSVNFAFDVKENSRSGFVVPLSLQLLLENCIKHNFATSAKPLNISIFTEDGFLCVENNLQEREKNEERAGIGLANIVQRYALITNRNVFIEKSEDYFKVKIPLLTEKINVMNTQNTSEQAAYEKASKRVEELKGFYGNLISYCIFIPFLIFINLKTSPQYHWFWWPMLGWGIGVIAHGIQTFGIGSDWEERQIRKFMEKDQENAKKWK